jgi:hypothetical protein
LQASLVTTGRDSVGESFATTEDSHNTAVLGDGREERKDISFGTTL